MCHDIGIRHRSDCYADKDQLEGVNMAEQPESSCQKRVERLEAVVTELERVLEQTIEAPKQKEMEETVSPPETLGRVQAGAPPDPTKPIPVSSQPSRKFFKLPKNMKTSEYRLNKLGIGLLLFGVAFLFTYSIDQGWLTPPVRIGFGMFLGLGLAVAGFRISADRRHFSKVLTGSGIAVFYITGFAAFQLFNLVSYPIASVFMISITSLAFVLSLKQNGTAIAIIAAAGGLAPRSCCIRTPVICLGLSYTRAYY